MPRLFPSSPESLVDQQGRPYFLWDEDTTLERFRELLRDPDPEVRSYYIGKVMRQAKPDDALSFVTPMIIAQHWNLANRYLGQSRPFWSWWMEIWKEHGDVPR